MLINEKDALSRIGSPLNLLNRLRDTSNKKDRGLSIFGVASRQDNKDNTTREKLAVPTFHNPFSKTEATALVPQLSDEQTRQLIPSSSPEPTVDNIIEDADSQIKLKLAHDTALEALQAGVEQLKLDMPNMPAGKLPAAITAASKVVESIRKERNEANKARSGNREVHLHFYTPTQKQESDYPVIEVGA